MANKFDMFDRFSPRIAYVRPVDKSELPIDIRDQAAELDNLYAVHDVDGERLALVDGKQLAFSLARENDLAPVHVH